MPKNGLGNFIRERRSDLGLTQEELAARVGNTATQAEISRLERGHVLLPRRDRLEALALALEVSLGSLLANSGWMTNDEGNLVDRVVLPLLSPFASTSDAMLTEMFQIREALLIAIDRLAMLEEKVKTGPPQAHRPGINVPIGIFDDWESSAMFEA